MALDKLGLKDTIVEILSDMETRTEDAKEEFAERLSTAIDVFVKTGTVQTTGTASAQTGTIT